MIGRLEAVVLDCPDPAALAAFYSELLGLPVAEGDEDWASIGGGDQPRVSFQRAPDHPGSTWPDETRPQQFHLDVEVDDVETAEAAALALGARRLPGAGEGFRVYADPAGHPFCLTWG